MSASIASNCSYTIQVVDQILAIDKQHHMSLKQENLLANLVKQTLKTIKSEKRETENNLRKLFALLFSQESSEDTTDDNSKLNSSHLKLTSIDVFHYLVLFTLSSSSMDANSRFFMFKLMLQLQSLQILLNYIIANNLSKLVSVNDNQCTSLTNYLIQRLKLKPGAIENNLNVDVTQMISSLKKSLMPFLRCSVLFYCFLNEIAQSIELADYIQNDQNDFDKLIVRLGLSPVEFNELIFNLNNNKSLLYLAERYINTNINFIY